MVLPQLVAHRGHAARCPENTLAALESAIDAGARFVEVDVQLSKDGVPVLFHDRTLRRMCGVSGAVHERTLAELRALSCSEPERFGNRFQGEGLLSLAGFVQLLASRPRVSAFVEIKRVAIEQFGSQRVLERVLPALEPALRRCALISFSLEFLAATREAHAIPVGAVFDRWNERLDPRVTALDPEYLFVDVEGLPPEGALAHGRSRLAVYEVAEPERARALGERGVHLVETFAIADMLAALGDAPLSARYDLIVVGGGIHGVGVLQAAAAAGHDCLLLESRAIAAGTSSRSSKLIHGGLRYLESAQVALVRESLRERAILLAVAPKLVRLVPFHVPIYATTARRPRTLRAGLAVYALLGNLRRAALYSELPRARWNELDGLDVRGLEAVFRYHDGQTDDAALARAVLRSAQSLGAEVRVPASFLGARRALGARGETDGWEVRFDAGGREERCECAVLVNAAGPWVDGVRRLVEPTPPGAEVELVSGAHVELEGRLERGIYYVEAPRDRRAVFAIPWKGRTLVGTTETPYTGDPARVEPLASEVEYLLETFAHHFPDRPRRVLASWAGLRVLPRDGVRAFDRPRETTFAVDDERAPRTLAIYGGKLTGYRATAEKVLARLAPTLPRRTRRARTDELPLEPEPGFTLD